MNKIVITKFEDKIVTAEFFENVAVDINFEKQENMHIEDIFVGRVDSVAKNINAAFIEIGEGVKCFYQLKKDDKLKIGDELPVQIMRDAVKTKDAECAINLSIPGKLVVVTEGLYSLGISAKIPDSDRKFELQQLFDSSFSYDDSYSFIIRTNAMEASDGEILEEAHRAIDELKAIRDKASHSTVYKKLYSGNSYYKDKLRDMHCEFEVVTDIKDIYDELSASFPDDEISFYEDELLPLAKLYKIETVVEEALGRKVWLKSGGYLVIDETEALTVIDVNTGKNDKGKNIEETFFKTNVEAVYEATRQMRLRNLSGIIIIDFIDMKRKEHLDELVRITKERLFLDPVRANFVDVTKLNLFEITRKKMHKSLREQVRS